MCGEGALRPRFGAAEAIIRRVVADEVHGQLTPDSQLFETGLAVTGRGVGIADGERHGVRPDVSEMQIGRQLAGGVVLGRVAALGVAGQALGNESA